MGKRFIISMLLVVAIIGSIAAGSALFFQNRYHNLAEAQAEQSVADTQNIQDLAAAGAALEQQPITGSNSEDAADSSSESFSTSVAPSDDAAQADANAARARVMLRDMTLEEKICQMLFVTPEALTGYTRVTQSGDTTKAAIEKWPVGGIIYFSTNLVSTDQTTEMIENIQSFSESATGRRLFIGVDEEGGTVARAADSLGTTQFDDMSVYGETGDTQEAYNIGATQAKDLTALGFNVNFSPVADVLTNEDNTVVKQRSFGSDPDLVASMVSQVVKGLTDGGMLCAPKHFPGHGSTGGDTHDGFASSDRTLEELESCDFKPFQAAIEAGAPMIMVGHMTMTAIDPDNPASLSETIVTGLLREELGYDGIIITDALNMGAIANNYTNADAAVKAVSAGCDMLLCVSNISSVVNALTDAVSDGTISEERIDESVSRILQAKLRYGIIS
mgnify:FL=1